MYLFYIGYLVYLPAILDSLFHGPSNTTSTSITVENGCDGGHKVVGFPGFKNLTLPNDLLSLAGHVVIYSRLTVCQVPPRPFQDHPNTHGCQTGFRKRPALVKVYCLTFDSWSIVVAIIHDIIHIKHDTMLLLSIINN